MRYTFYALSFSDDQVYIGMTSDLEKRVEDHMRGKTKLTKNKKIIKVCRTESCDKRTDARKREKYWKSGCGKEQLKKAIFKK